MLFPEEDGPLLKAWIVKRIENTSDADSDVLADYVIALLKHDGDRDAVRKLCEQEIPDFLSEDPKTFLDDVFQAITYKSYLPGAPPAPKLGSEPQPQPTSLSESAPQNGSRKRGFHDRDDTDGQDGPQHGGRAAKQSRRAAGRERRDDARGGRYMRGLPQPQDMAFDPKVMEAAFLQMSSMAMPTYPGMPGMPPQGFGGGRNQPRRRGRCRDFDTKGFCSRGSTCPYDHGNESIFVPPMGPGGDERGDPNEYPFMPNPSNPMNPFNFTPDTNRGGNTRGRRNRGQKKGGGGGARAPFSADGPVHDRSKSTIVVESIPEENFTEEQVRGFFSQFGNITEVSMQPYKRLAIVKYDKWGAANAAYQSPKVIFDNRFVKVFWYRDKADALPPTVPLQAGNWSGDPQATGEEDEEVEPELDMEEFQRKQEEAQKQHQERESKRADIEKQRLELETKQQELLARHREENAKLQAKLAGQKGEDGEVPSSGAQALRAQLAVLEQEAKMLGLDPNAEDEGSVTSAPWHPPGGYRGGRGGGYRGRGGYAPRGRGSFRGRGGSGNMHAAYAQYSIDNRPKKLAVAGVDFTAPEKDEVLRHFLINLGEFESVDTGPTVTHVSFQDRKTAERFYYTLQGKELPGIEGRLELSWVSTPLPPVNTAKTAGNGETGAAHTHTDEKEHDAMAGFDDHPRRERSAELQDEERPVNMDYEVADEDGW